MANIKEFVKKALTEIEESVPQKEFLLQNINFEVSVGASSRTKGGFALHVLEAGSDIGTQTTQKISFTVSNKKTADHGLRQLNKFITIHKLLRPEGRSFPT